MPSLRHEAIVQLFRNRPSLAPELIRGPLCQPLPQYHDVEVQEADLSQITPTEYHSDLVVLLSSGEPVFGIVVEVQLGRDEKKPYSWPLYQAALRARLRCPVCVLVVAPEPGVAEWARRPIETGQPGVPFVPLVLGAESVPVVTDAEVARLLAEIVLGLLEDRDVTADEIALFFQAIIALIAETARRYACSKEQRQSQERAAYLARLTHQMRTPLTVLKLHVGALSRSTTPADERLVGSIERTVKRLTLLVDGVMRLERFKPEEIPVLPVELSPAKLIDQVVDDNAYDAERKALRVEVLVNRVLRMQIDPTLFVDALGNLLQNAIKYTKAGHVLIEVEERATEVVFKVRDTGPGISREKQLAMFKTIEPDTAGGAGIGLTIVHRAATAQGGTVGVESEPGQGSLFWFTLPRTVKPRNAPSDA